MAGRKADPMSPYRVFVHKDKKYKYAATQRPIENTQGKKQGTKSRIGEPFQTSWSSPPMPPTAWQMWRNA